MRLRRRHLWLIPAALLILLALGRIFGDGPTWRGVVSMLFAAWFTMMAFGVLDRWQD